MMDQLSFLVKGSSPQPCQVRLTRKGLDVTAFCTCPAGENGQICKHRLAILRGLTENMISGNIEDVPKAAEMISGSKIEQFLNEVVHLECELTRIKSQLANAKKKLAKAMRGEMLLG